MKTAFAPICAHKNNRRIWRRNASTSLLRDVTDQLWWRHNAKWEKAPGFVLSRHNRYGLSWGTVFVTRDAIRQWFSLVTSVTLVKNRYSHYPKHYSIYPCAKPDAYDKSSGRGTINGSNNSGGGKGEMDSRLYVNACMYIYVDISFMSICTTQHKYIICIYRKISNIRRTKTRNLNVYRLVLQLSLPNPMKPGVKSRIKM